MFKKKTRYIVKYTCRRYGFDEIRYVARKSLERALEDIALVNADETNYTTGEYVGESRMLPFNPEAAKKGAPVCFDDGTPVRIVCYDRKHEIEYNGKKKVRCPIIGLYPHTDGNEWVVRATKDGMNEYGDRPVLFMV